ncbi:MAG: hypothetical protein AAGA96_02785 [Verrucomicrobiota bacterium]
MLAPIESCAEARIDARVLSLQVTSKVDREGWVVTEKRFSLQVDGKDIKRGPCLSFLTVYEGPGGLILNNGLEVLEVTRAGNPEPYHLDHGDGFLTLFCGSSELELEPGIYQYMIRSRSRGSWKHLGEDSYGAFDITGPFQHHPIDSLDARLEFPENVEAKQFSAALMGHTGTGSGYEAGKDGSELWLKSTAPLSSNHAVFMNVVWPSSEFAHRSQWLQILQQHPRVPLSVFAATVLLVALMMLIRNALRVSPRSTPGVSVASVS